MLEQNITKKGRVKKILKLDTSNNNSKKYKLEAIWDSAVYIKKSESGYLLGFYYLLA